MADQYRVVNHADTAIRTRRVTGAGRGHLFYVDVHDGDWTGRVCFPDHLPAERDIVLTETSNRREPVAVLWDPARVKIVNC